ncbi:hypothetical protein CFB82_19905 [Burkholderia sp. HI2714]|uniref:hypothetical protein n=1 Tax=Burkholderia sp. HI2714 TaxID=2015359 RepID=UPI000B7A0E95|nr:hypothetical protein [Burkholderia sp. HI2714]OXJ32652.1 hypothetical protein CFB82_19905 [Burkholderia sp. HI2714]
MQTFKKLPYTDFHQMKAALEAGTVFRIKDGGRDRRVTRIEPLPSGKVANVYYEGSTSSYGCFTPDGANRACVAFIYVESQAPSLADQLKAKLTTATVNVAAVPAKPFLERFIAGTEFHTPHTREVVVGVAFVRGHNRLDVTLRDEAGKERVTPRYNTDGTHKFRSERNLVEGKLPPKMVERKVAIYRHAFNGSLFVIREGEVLPSIRGISNATKVGETTITEKE